MFPHCWQISLHLRQTSRVAPQKSQGARSCVPSGGSVVRAPPAARSLRASLLFKVEREVHRRRRMGERADRNAIHAGRGDERHG